jgi:NitT/TauT family transport system ATP-binding protein
MEDIFPLGTGIGRVRGIVNIMKQHKGHMGMSELAEEAEEHVDDLLPLIEACKLLGLVVIDESEIRLTETGSRLTFSNFSKSIHDRLSNVEPFKSALKIMDDGAVSSPELFSTLKNKGIIIHGDEATNDLLLMKLFIRWGVRGKIMSYDPETDSWSKR